MYQGNTTEGIDREVVASLEASRYSRTREVVNLGIPEICILSRGFFEMNKCKALASNTVSDCPIFAGYKRAFSFIVDEQLSLFNECKGQDTADGKGDFVFAAHPDDHPANTQRLDPTGIENYSCQECGAELSNIYARCEGCFHIFDREYNICIGCYEEKQYKGFRQMHANCATKVSYLNHTGHFPFSGSRKVCKKYGRCTRCGDCAHCGCQCHTKFEVRFRFWHVKQLKQAQKWLNQPVPDPMDESCILDDMQYLKQRLDKPYKIFKMLTQALRQKNEARQKQKGSNTKKRKKST
jgi:hypothetical protein